VFDDVWVWSRLDSAVGADRVGAGAGDPKMGDMGPGSEDIETEDEGVVEPKLEALHWLPTLSPLLSVHADSSPFWLKNVTRPLVFTTIHAFG